jgi:NAD(P)-dependent dehydrogenase (short-subunit alcohol dehydrogenase family)
MNKHVLVTGATGALGSKIAFDLASSGFDLALCSRDKLSLKGMGDEITSKFDVQVELGDFSISDEDSLGAFAKQASRNHGGFTGGVHTAGTLGPISRLSSVPSRDWIDSIQTNLIGSFVFLKTMVSQLEGGQGSLVVLSGGGATSPMPGLSSYAASKAAVVRLVETVAQELEGTGVRLNAVAPGIMKSKMTRTMIETGSDSMDPDQLSKIRVAIDSKEDSSQKAVSLIRFLLETKINGLNGKLVSAQWDEWQSWSAEVNPFSDPNILTLRRTI